LVGGITPEFSQVKKILLLSTTLRLAQTDPDGVHGSIGYGAPDGCNAPAGGGGGVSGGESGASHV